MKFKNTTIPPSGRNKYGNYISSSEITKSVIRTTYNGNASTGGNNIPTPTEKPKDVMNIFLSRTSLTFKGEMFVDKENVMEEIDILGYINSKRGDTFIGNINVELPEEDVMSNNQYYDITGLTSNIGVQIKNNGTQNTQLVITANKNIVNETVLEGTILIPCNIWGKSGDISLGPYLNDWIVEKEECFSIILELSYNVTKLPATDAYKLELTNELAGINCDKDGNIYPNAVRPTCQAIIYHGEKEEDKGVQYGISYPSSNDVQGVSIDTTTGILTFGSNFSFVGSSLEITVTATIGITTVKKIMTICKQYAGENGSPAITRWVVPSANVIKLNPNTNLLTPNKISCKVMKQEGEDSPIEDSGTTIYYGYNTDNPLTEYTADIDIDASKDYIAFALKNNSVVYEIETIPIIKEGANGTNGESVYRLTLSNENTSINADSNGNIYPNAVKPTCTAKLFYGTMPVNTAIYSITTSTEASGVTINPSTGVITFGSDFNFNEKSLEITVTAKIGSTIYGTSIMTVSKSIEGAKGDDAVSYWLDLSTTQISVDVDEYGDVINHTPTTVNLKAYRQIGYNLPENITNDNVIRWGYDTNSPQNQTTTITDIDTYHSLIMVHLVVGGVIYDRQTITILKNGKNGIGENGRNGAAIRGPVDWKNQTTTRVWCSGQDDADFPESSEFIDIIVYNNEYYRCIVTHKAAGGESNSPSTKYWEKEEKQYDFIASNLLLAENAKIKFATNNELYLTDDNGQVTAGAKGGEDVSFWAGANEPENGNFKVYYDGTMEATKGKFGLLEIGADKWDDAILWGTHTQNDNTVNRLSLQPHMLEMKATYNDTLMSDVRIGPYADADNYDMEGEISVYLKNENRNGIFTNAFVFADEGFRSYNNSRTICTPFSTVNNLTFAFITDTNYFTSDNERWYWNGMPISEIINATVYPYIKIIDGEWKACASSTSTYGLGTGIFSTSHVKQNNMLYIVI